jgi:hypothetical protein
VNDRHLLAKFSASFCGSDPKKLPDLIDFFVVKNISTNYIKIGEGFDLNSDHSPIYVTVSDKIITKDQNPVLTNTQTGLISTIY